MQFNDTDTYVMWSSYVGVKMVDLKTGEVLSTFREITSIRS